MSTLDVWNITGGALVAVGGATHVTGVMATGMAMLVAGGIACIAKFAYSAERQNFLDFRERNERLQRERDGGDGR